MLDRTLAPHFANLIQKDNRPIAVAFSGGGDSTALLYMFLNWVKQNSPREVIALIVDHGLREGSAGEAQLAATRARNMGAKAKILTWHGEKPITAIQEKARNARYKLLGDMCRTLGVGQLLLGHNQDDQAETIYMRIQNQSGWRGMAGMGARKTSPLWPELYGVDVLRPLLGVTRDELRGFNREDQLEYIDDPSNENRHFTRIRTRETLAGLPEIKAQLLQVSISAQENLRAETGAISLFFSQAVDFFEWGGARISLRVFNDHKELTSEALKYLILAVSGDNQITPENQRQSLVRKMSEGNFTGSTLGGVQFIPKEGSILAVRDPGAVLGRREKPAQEPQKILPQAPIIWDGRFIIETGLEGLSIDPLVPHVDKLSKLQKQKLKELPVEARAGLPCLLKDEAVVATYMDIPSQNFEISCLVKHRLSALLGEG